MITALPARFFDFLRDTWCKPQVSRRISIGLVLIFICSGVGILLKKMGLLPAPIASITPDSPFQAIQLAFTLVLLIEVVQLIFAVADSVSRAVGKQLEIMALILLRDAFKDISLLHSPLNLADDYSVLLQIIASTVASLLLFIGLGCYVKLQRLQGYIKNAQDMCRYINAKKCISLLLFVAFLSIGAYDIYTALFKGVPTTFFLSFYSTLIFTDILLVLVGQYFMPSFHPTFRNSGYAVGTLLMRIALGAPHYVGSALCVFAALYLLALTWATTRFSPPPEEPAGRPTQILPIAAESQTTQEQETPQGQTTQNKEACS